MANQWVLFLVWLSLVEKVNGFQFKRINKCGRYSRLKNPYYIGQAFSNIDCINQCVQDKGCVAVTSCTQGRTRWRICEYNNNLAGLHDCENHDLSNNCAVWKKKDPCQTEATFVNNTCVCPLPYKGVTCQFYQPVSCSEIHQLHALENITVVSDVFELYPSPGKAVQVFCDFKNDTFGAMYIPKSSLSQLTATELKVLVPNKKEFVLRERRENDEEKEAVLSVLPSFLEGSWTITLGIDESLFSRPPINEDGAFIFIGGVPRDKINETNNFGFLVDKKEFSYPSCDKTPNNYFIFYTKTTSETTKNKSSTCLEWQNALNTLPKSKLPSKDFFYFIEIHIKCAAWCLIDDFSSLIGLAPGFIFN